MAVIEESIIALAAANAGLVAQIGSRFYPAKAPNEPTFPLCVYQRISSARDHVMGHDTGLVGATFQVSTWGKTYTSMSGAAAAVRAAFQDYTGTPLAAGPEIQRVFLENEFDVGFDVDAAAHGRVFEFRIWFRE